MENNFINFVYKIFFLTYPYSQQIFFLQRNKTRMGDFVVLDAQNHCCQFFELFKIDGDWPMSSRLHSTVDQPAHSEVVRRHENFVLISPGFQGGASILVGDGATIVGVDIIENGSEA